MQGRERERPKQNVHTVTTTITSTGYSYLHGLDQAQGVDKDQGQVQLYNELDGLAAFACLGFLD